MVGEEASLWGEYLPQKDDDIKTIVSKIKKPKVVKERTTEQKLKSKTVSINEKLSLIEEEVHRILGKNEDNIECIRSYDRLVEYFDKAISNGIIAIDTETGDKEGKGTLNNIDCNLMGLCIYTPGEKAAYVPVSHYNYEIYYEGRHEAIALTTKLENQLTTDQIAIQLKRLLEQDVKEIYHNAYFDLPVIYTTCGVRLKCYWDTSLGAPILNENEQSALKTQYKLHCDKDAEKYSIEKLFGGLPYAIFSPELFSLYAAQDAWDTYCLYEYQIEQFSLEENKSLNEVHNDVEEACIETLVNMHLRGVCIDKKYAAIMSKEYHAESDKIQAKIDIELAKLAPAIAQWKLTPEANAKQKKKDGSYGGKSKVEQLSDPIELSSPVQLAILLYDIMKVPVVDKSSPRGTDKDILKELAEAKHVELCSLMLEKRGVDILINTFIDKIPEMVQEKTGKLHCSFKSMGAATGRMSSQDPNLQQIPSVDKKIRMIFEPSKEYNTVGQINSQYDILYYEDVKIQLDSGHYYKHANELAIGDKLITDDGSLDTVKSIERDGDHYIIHV